ncbi:MAG TPA: hypothetical protein VL418_04940 [Devosiaceae bacterium]|nr:hypothetical protein [Devosiaceae bacterium]
MSVAVVRRLLPIATLLCALPSLSLAAGSVPTQANALAAVPTAAAAIHASGNVLLAPDPSGMRAALEKKLTAVGADLPETEVALAKLLLAGRGGPVDRPRALKLLQHALEGGDGEAGYVLGVDYLTVEGREDEAIVAFRSALRLGYLEAGLVLADQLRPTDPEQAASLLSLSLSGLEAQASRDASAAFALGDFYRKRGGAADLAQAVAWYQKASGLGAVKGLYWIARLESVPGSPVGNPQHAVALYDQAAGLGSVDAAREIAVAADRGTLPVSKARADYWMKNLLAIGDITAQLLYADRADTTLEQRRGFSDQLFARLMADPQPEVSTLGQVATRFRDGNGLVVDPQRALSLYGRAMAQGDKDSTLEFAKLVLAQPALDTPENSQAAYRRVLSLAEANSSEASVVLGDMTLKGVGTKPDPERALQLYQRAAEAGSIVGMIDLASIYGADPDLHQRAQAVPWLQKAANAGSVSSMTALARIYADGTLVGPDRLKAVALYRQAIDKGESNALDGLATLYVQLGGDQAQSLAQQVYQRAILAGNPDASLRFALFLVRNGRGQQALAELQKPELKGRVEVALTLARLYFTGEAGTVDAAKARHWLDVAINGVGEDPEQRVAVATAMLDAPGPDLPIRAVAMLKEMAKSGVSEAERLLGAAYLSGKGVAANPTEGLDHYAKAITLGNAAARVELADILATGNGTKADPDRAAALYHEALGNAPDDARANLGLGRLYSVGRPGRPDPSSALLYYRRAAQSGDPAGEVALGKAYLNGSGVAEDAGVAAQWLRSAAEQGSQEAEMLLAGIHSAGTVGEINPEAAFALNYGAANRNYIPAMIGTADALISGFGVSQDADAGVAWLERAASLGSNEAMYGLYQVYSAGLAGPADNERAAAWLNQAASAGNPSALYKLALELLGTKTASDRVKAIEMLKRAAELKHSQSKKMLASLGVIPISSLKDKPAQ